ncbi:MAG: hypothetical protein HQ582_13225 [Planctomycetes bacterium]|nr:hypothetical protein [Planctomycetota bacterium]
MAAWFETVTDLRRDAEVLRRRSYGLIEAVEGRFRRVLLRPFPKLISLPEVSLFGRWRHGSRPGDRCRLYYDQPRRFRNFLTVKYLVSSRGTTRATLHRVLDVLDEIARIKGTDAILCTLVNGRISEQVMHRYGWGRHCPSRWYRHYIKRLYGDYPRQAGWISSVAEQVEPGVV